MIKLITVIDSVRGILQDRPEEIIKIVNRQIDKHGRLTLYESFSDLYQIKTSIESASALPTPVWVLGNARELEMALPFAMELFIIQVDGVFDSPEQFPHFEDRFIMTNRKPIQRVSGLLFQCQQWRPDLTNLKDSWDVDVRDDI